MESISAVLGYLDLVAKKNSGYDRPAGFGDQGNRIPKDVIQRKMICLVLMMSAGMNLNYFTK
jgi:hypothetical protein